MHPSLRVCALEGFTCRMEGSAEVAIDSQRWSGFETALGIGPGRSGMEVSKLRGNR